MYSISIPEMDTQLIMIDKTLLKKKKYYAEINTI